MQSHTESQVYNFTMAIEIPKDREGVVALKTPSSEHDPVEMIKHLRDFIGLSFKMLSKE